jgi:hypothetical protein
VLADACANLGRLPSVGWAGAGSDAQWRLPKDAQHGELDSSSSSPGTVPGDQSPGQETSTAHLRLPALPLSLQVLVVPETAWGMIAMSFHF